MASLAASMLYDGSGGSGGGTHSSHRTMSSNNIDGGSGEYSVLGRMLNLTWVNDRTVTYVCVLFAVMCCIIAFSDLREHLARFDYPKLQVLEMRIILMIPIYAVFSSLSLLFPAWMFFFGTVRDTYESFVLYMFFMLMIAYCGGEGQLLRSLKRKRYKGIHLFPMCWLPSFPLDTDFYLRCKRWVLQCALIKPVCSFIAMVAAPAGIYHEGHFTVDNVYTYTCILVNLSLTWALYYLVLFEVECEKELHYARTFLKFMCIKSIIFFSYWQSVAISLAASAQLLYLGSDSEEKERTSNALQNVLMCIELLPVALMHRAAFGRNKLDEEMASVPVYMKDNNSGNFRSNVDTALNVNDIIDDTLGTIFYRRGKLVDQENAEGDEDEGDGSGGGGGGHGRHDTRNSAAAAAASAQADGRDGAAIAVDARGRRAGRAGRRYADTQQRGSNGDDESDMDNDGEEAMAAHEVLAREPTLEELVRHAVASDYGVRVDGLLHYDEDSDREEHNNEMHYSDTDVILRRSRHQAATADVRVDTDELRSHYAHMFATPQVYCVVCGRFDRELVRRKNGYKCRECVGTKSRSLLRHHQREATSSMQTPTLAHDADTMLATAQPQQLQQQRHPRRGGSVDSTSASSTSSSSDSDEDDMTSR